MIEPGSVFAVDGHDGAGKTTQASMLASRIGGSYQRPFQGALGAALLDSASRGDAAKVIALGEEGIANAIAAAGSARPVVLDRSWMTVASLVDWDLFVGRWHSWIPTALCWSDLPTTLSRLRERAEKPEPVSSHAHYLDVYLTLAKLTGSFVLRTDRSSAAECNDLLLHWLRSNPPLPQISPFPARAESRPL